MLESSSFPTSIRLVDFAGTKFSVNDQNQNWDPNFGVQKAYSSFLRALVALEFDISRAEVGDPWRIVFQTMRTFILEWWPGGYFRGSWLPSVYDICTARLSLYHLVSVDLPNGHDNLRDPFQCDMSTSDGDDATMSSFSSLSISVC